MKAEKRIITMEPVDIQIEEVTLLSEEEYDDCKKYIQLCEWWWWLRSPGYNQYYAARVSCVGPIYNRDVDDDRGCVRPALRISNLESSNLTPGDKFELAGYTWTVISDEIALWKTKYHEDGEPCFGGGWFLVTIQTPEGDYGYHYEEKYWNMFDCQVLKKARHWDGYTDKDVGRLLSLI